jgi:hypothetical protein
MAERRKFDSMKILCWSELPHRREISLRRVCMLITAIESLVVSLPFDMGGPHPLFAGQPWDHLDILVVKIPNLQKN